MNQNKLIRFFVFLAFCGILALKPLLSKAIVSGDRVTQTQPEENLAIEEGVDLSRFTGFDRFITTKDNRLELYDVETGQRIKELDVQGDQGVIFEAGKVNFILVSKEENKVCCYAKNGELVWQKSFSLPLKGVALDEVLCYLHLGSPWGLVNEIGAGDSFPEEKLVACRLEDGKPVWEYNLKGEAILRFEPRESEGELAVFSLDLTGNRIRSKLRLLSGTGKIIAGQEYGDAPIYEALGYDKDRSWVGLGNRAVQFFTYDGLRLWTKQFLSQPLLISQFGSGEILVVEESELTCLDRQGRVVWDRKLKLPPGEWVSTEGEGIVALGRGNRVYVFNCRGKIVKTLRLKDSVTDLFFDSNGELLILEQTNTIKRIKLGGGIK